MSKRSLEAVEAHRTRLNLVLVSGYPKGLSERYALECRHLAAKMALLVALLVALTCVMTALFFASS